jgi:hypothetical protein
MNVSHATQTFSAREQQIQHHSLITLPALQVPIQNASVPAETSASAPTANAESTASEPQNEEGMRFSARETVSAVKRILEQLNSGKLLSWIEGNSLEKIQAQQQADHKEQQQQQAAAQGQVFEFSYRYQQVAASFSGEVQLSDGSSQSFAFSFALEEEYLSARLGPQPSLQDPLVLSTTGQSFQWTGQSSAFDFFGDGRQFALPTLAAGQYYLSYDRNGDGQVNSGKELFGPASGAGFAELSALDSDTDGFIDAGDDAYAQLGVWRPGEQWRALSAAGIGAISAQSVSTSFGLYDGDALLARIARSGIYLDSAGGIGLVQQVDLNI